MNLFKLISGQLEVNKIIKRKENNLYLIFPSNSEIAYYGILYAEKYAKEIKAERIIIVTENDTISDNSDRMISLPKRIYKVSTKKMEGFLTVVHIGDHGRPSAHGIVLPTESEEDKALEERAKSLKNADR